MYRPIYLAKKGLYLSDFALLRVINRYRRSHIDNLVIAINELSKGGHRPKTADGE